jgi:hypothetical protein
MHGRARPRRPREEPERAGASLLDADRLVGANGQKRGRLGSLKDPGNPARDLADRAHQLDVGTFHLRIGRGNGRTPSRPPVPRRAQRT